MALGITGMVSNRYKTSLGISPMVSLLTKPILPLFLTINCTEGAEALHQMGVLRQRLTKLGGEFVFKMDNEPRGHKVTLDPEILGTMNFYLKQRLN